ncbi:MAG: ABC transporter ATP-binding protein, partial [Acidimicrobiales bacterium]|nr:ABC transporter ATP-binding protein [Acidimicrobiales bacterium]
MAGAAIELEDVHHAYDDDEVLHGIDLKIDRGEVFGFLGHNGAGKTTAMNVLTTLIRPTSGSARVCGFDVVDDRREVAARIGYLPADVRLYGHMSARENLEFFARLSGVDDPKRSVIETLDYLDAAEYADRRMDGFSTGMRQRVGIAQAILHRPEVLFLDEPTSGLDPMGVRQLRETISRLNQD